MTSLFMDVDTALGIEGGDIDDALAIAYLAGQPAWAGLSGISIVGGNVSRDSGIRSTLYICELLSLEVPVYSGADTPLDRPLRTGHSIVMGDPSCKENWIYDRDPLRKPESIEFGDWLDRQDPSFRFTLLATGPMTNVARLLDGHPESSKKIERIMSMGGWYIGEERFPEFNMMVDPLAADIVLKSGIPITIVPLEMTLQTCLLPERISEWLNYGEAGKAFYDGTISWMDKMKSIRGQEGCHLHDPLAAVALLHPEIVETVGIIPTIDVETGKTDVLAENPDSHVHLVRKFDHRRFHEILLEGIREALLQVQKV